MRTMKYLPPEKRVRKSKETLEIYAPLASRLGMGQIRGELEDLAFQWVYPEEFKQIKEQTHILFKEGDRFISLVKRNLHDILDKEHIPASVEGRAKHLYSLWKKLQRPEYDNDITKIPDLVAARIIIERESIEDCYIVLGLVHQAWTPVAGRISDYIASPKANGYRSLHTKVFDDKGRIMEVQIRTLSMHEQAEYGIASHIIYEQAKARKGVSNKQVDEGFKASKEQLEWIKELTKWQSEVPDSEKFLAGLRHDIFKDRIFVYTPKGDVKDLPFGATPVDFAYSVHSEIGNRTVGAKINGHIVPLNYQLRSGEIIEIITSKEKKKPSPDWLQFVVSNTAKKQIQKTISPQQPAVQQQKEDLEKEEESISEQPHRPKKFPIPIPGSKYLIDSLSMIEKARSAFKKTFKTKNNSAKAGVIVHGLNGVATRLAKCCNPLPGEEIVGFVTDEQVVSIHRAACPNLAKIVHREKQIPVKWSLPPGVQKSIRIKVEMGYRENALRDVTKVITDSKVAVEQFEQLPTSDGTLKIQFVVGIDSPNQQSFLYSRLQKIKDVHSVE